MLNNKGIAVTVYASGRILSVHVARDEARQAAIEASLGLLAEVERPAVRKLIGSIAEGGGEVDSGGYIFSHPVRLQGKVTTYDGHLTIYPCEVCS